MKKQTPEASNNPYRVIDLSTAFDPVINPDGTAREKRFTPRSVTEIELSIVNDTNTTISIFNGEVKKSDHFIDGHPRFDGPIDACIYLDKSARPVCDIVAQLWDSLSSTANDHFPSPSFLNIDKEHYAVSMGISENIQNPNLAEIDINNMPESLLRKTLSSIRSQYLSNDDIKKINPDNFEEEVWNYPTVLEGKHVAILDEVKSSGATLLIATQLIESALNPVGTAEEAKTGLEPIYWSVPNRISWRNSSESVATDQFAVRFVAPWYDNDTSDGRYGIDDRNEKLSEQSTSLRQKLGRYVLSVPRSEMDKKSLDLMHDIRVLAQRLSENRIAVQPIIGADIATQKARLEERYGIPFKQLVPLLQKATTIDDFSEAVAKVRNKTP